MQPYDDSLVLDRLLGQMDLAFTNITGQTISFIDHRGRWHGPLRLEIDVKADSKLLRITVSDNGEGIPQQVLRQLEGAEGEGSGLRNVSDRLKLFFGPEARLDISSRPGEGTRVELLCPLGAEGGEAGV